MKSMNGRQSQGLRPIKDLVRERSIILKGADAISQHGFTQVPNAVLKSAAISPGAKLTYAMLLSYAWHEDFCFPGQERLAKDMGVSRRSTNTYIQELSSKKFLSIKRLGQGRTNIYELNLTPAKRRRKRNN